MVWNDLGFLDLFPQFLFSRFWVEIPHDEPVKLGLNASLRCVDELSRSIHSIRS
jgi:hypothetical protein